MYPITAARVSFYDATGYIQTPDIYDVADASSTADVLAPNEIDPTPASAYWTASVGGWLGSGLHTVEFELRGETSGRSELNTDTRAAMIGAANRNQPIPFTTDWFGQELYQAAIYMSNGRLYNGGGTTTYLKNPDNTVWTPTNLGALVSLLLDTTVDPVKGYIYRANQVTPGFCRNQDGSVPDPLKGENPNFTLPKTGDGRVRAVIGDASNSPRLRAIIIPAANRSLQ